MTLAPATPRLSSETVYASTVAKDGRAVMIMGQSGAGKSDLALRLIDRGFALVSDDQTVLKRDADRLLSAAPTTIAGKLEVRGIGIVELDHVGDVPVALGVALVTDMERLPEEDRERNFLGASIPFVTIDARTASAAAKVSLALDKLGLRF